MSTDEQCPIAQACGGCLKHAHGLNLYGLVTSQCPYDAEFDCKVVDDAPAILQQIKESPAYIAQHGQPETAKVK